MPSEAITVELDKLPPSANRLWRFYLGRALKSSEYRAWLDATAWSFRQQAKNRKVEGHYAIRIYAARPDKRRRDLDNLLKPLSDALVAAGIVSDDGHCERLSAEWCVGFSGVRILIIATKGSV